MPFKINIGTKQGKTYKLETEAEALVGKKLHDKIDGKDVSPDLEGYEFEITGASDKAGFTAMENVEGIGFKKVLLTYGKAMKKRPRREGKKKQSTPKPKGLRLRKTVRGNTISNEISQINLKLLKEGNKKLEEIFPDQTKTEEAPKEDVKPIEESKEETQPTETPKEEAKPIEAPKEEKPEENKPSEGRVGGKTSTKKNPEPSGEANSDSKPKNN